MDEFCANKDSQLKRCACSSRVNEFDSTKKRLADVEDKMLDFNQRLLTVNMDKEDAAALNQATEGELAFQQTDKSKSKQMLDEIAKKLNTSFSETNFNQSLGAISLSLDTDSAFDSVDSLAGASTTAKTGTALYSAALPVCREMAAEVCTDDELAIAESGYQVQIEQDCNTVAKSYQTQTDQAREKLREGSALLDMSRLDIYQKRNSDDILTCKQKMLTMLTDSTVCGENLGKCLDTTGRYIDPTTGDAFLTMDLSNLANLITRPAADESWTTAPSNQVFVTFLNSKKKFLESAMDQCQDIADSVWDAFMEDALAQIKLAQDSKLEEVRQSCTTLTTQCLTDTAKSLQDFDARALSTFGVAADKTVNAMCADVRNACTALLESTGGDTDWSTGITDIATDKTYETILQTCREVGRACIIQSCKSISGNFGLCENIQTSINRKSIINRSACWQEVYDCVASAGTDSLDAIWARLVADGTIGADGTFYETLYGTTNITNTDSSCSTTTATCGIYDICMADGRCTDPTSSDCHTCRLAERLWGNCEVAPATSLEQSTSHNRIKTFATNSGNETLLSWFATNTGTNNLDDSCRDTSCGIGFTITETGCVPSEYKTSDGVMCSGDKKKNFKIGQDKEKTSITNCCSGNLVTQSVATPNNPQICCANGFAKGVGTTDPSKLGGRCLPADNIGAGFLYYYQQISSTMAYIYDALICVGELQVNKDLEHCTQDPADPEYPCGFELTCDGYYIRSETRGISGAQWKKGILPPLYSTDVVTGNAFDWSTYNYVVNSYQSSADNTCTMVCDVTDCRWPTSDENPACTVVSPTGWSTTYNK